MDSVKADFARDGYVVLRGALPATVCAAFGKATLDEYGRLVTAGWRFSGSGSRAGHLNIAMGYPGQTLLDAFRGAGLAGTVEALSGEPMILTQAVGNLNLPGSRPQDYHIDGLFDRPNFIANICLVSTDERNGSTEVIPESGSRRLSYWRVWRDGWRGKSVRPALEPGDVMIRTSTLWHRGTSNLSDTARPMAAFVWSPVSYGFAGDQTGDLAQPLTIFGNRYYGRFRRVREFVAVRLPWLDEGVRLGWSWMKDRRA